MRPNKSVKSKSKRKGCSKENSRADSDSDDEPLAVLLQSSDDKEACSGCQFVYGNKDDPRLHEKWISCECGKWFHESCAEIDGVLDDDLFHCKQCA